MKGFAVSWWQKESRRGVLCKKDVLRNFTKFTWKRLCQNLSFQRLKPASLFRKRLWHRCFPVNFSKLLRTLFFQNTFGNEICLWGRWNPSIRTKIVLFLTSVFLIINSLKAVYLLSKMRLSVIAFLSVFKFVFCQVDKLILYFYIFQRGFEFNISSFCVWHHCYCHCVVQYVPLLKKFCIFY